MSSGNYDSCMALGWSWFGIAKVRCYSSPGDWYTIWLLCITKHFAIGLHVDVPKRKAR